MSASTSPSGSPIGSGDDLRSDFETTLSRLEHTRPDSVSIDVEKVTDGIRITLEESDHIDSTTYDRGEQPLERWISTVLDVAVAMECVPNWLTSSSDGKRATFYLPAEPNLDEVAE